MDKAIFGLIGVVLGVILTVLKEWWIQSRKNKKETEYLAIQIISMLDRFTAACESVVGDDGLCHGQTDSDGYYRIQVAAPSFDPSSLKVEWKSLPANLMYEILTFPNEIEVADQLISAKFEYSAYPPEYADGFQERQLQYATLGIGAAVLASKLRKHAGLPSKKVSEWDPVKNMQERKQFIEERRAKSAVQHSLLMPPLPINSSVDV